MATAMGNTVLIVGPTFGITFNSPASRALARTNRPQQGQGQTAETETARELISTPTIQLLSASPH